MGDIMGFDGAAIVYCDGFFNTPSGKTAHGLVRHTRRYQVLSVIDAAYAGKDAREVLDGKATGIPVVADLAGAVADAKEKANLYAEAAGETLGLLKSVSESQGYDQPQPYMMKAELSAAPSDVPVATGELSFQINVQVTYAVEY